MDKALTYNERELIIKLSHGDDQAFETLYYHYVDRVYGFAYHFLNNAAETEEIIQEVFTKIWENRHNLNPGLSFNGYLLTTVKNTIFNENRKKLYHRTYVNDVISFMQTQKKDLEEEISSNNLMELIQKTIDHMPPKRQEIFRLCRMEGWSYRDVSKSLSIAEKTVEAHMRLAIKDLKKVLSPILDKLL